MSRVLLEKQTSFQLVKKLPTFYGTRMFIIAFTNAHHLSLSWASSIQSIPAHPPFWRSILTLSSLIHLGLPSGFFPSGLPTKTLYTPLLSPTRATYPAHLTLFDFITRTILGEQDRPLSSSLCNIPKTLRNFAIQPLNFISCSEVTAGERRIKHKQVSERSRPVGWTEVTDVPEESHGLHLHVQSFEKGWPFSDKFTLKKRALKSFHASVTVLDSKGRIRPF